MYSCTAPDNAPQKGITVSIEPLRYVTEQIAGNDFDIRVLVPPGSSPETYEPTPEQMKQVANSLAYIDIGPVSYTHLSGCFVFAESESVAGIPAVRESF